STPHASATSEITSNRIVRAERCSKPACSLGKPPTVAITLSERRIVDWLNACVLQIELGGEAATARGNRIENDPSLTGYWLTECENEVLSFIFAFPSVRKENAADIGMAFG